MTYTWQDIFAQPERFNTASEFLNMKNDDLKIVSWTNAAFAIELYYKALYLKITGSASDRNHDIETIFYGLSKDVQDEIKSDFYLGQNRRDNLADLVSSLKARFPDFSIDFMWNLKHVKYAFLGFRYVFEKRAAVIVFYPELRSSVIKQLNK